LSAEELTEQLTRLRARAGNPSVRELAKLTERQGPERAMSRSTIQDKFSGKSPSRLRQILALVQACADYANSIGAPLATEDTDGQLWRERVQAAQVRIPPPAPPPAPAPHPSPSPVDVPASRPPRWDLDPLLRAGMNDMIDLVQTSKGKPTAEWLPILTEALREAGMSDEQFLKAASMEQPLNLVDSILALKYYQEEGAVDRLIYLCAINQPAESIPIIMALLRRKGEDNIGAVLADQLIDTITGKRLGYPANIGLHHYVAIVRALRSATMTRGAIQILEGIGQHGSPDLILELAASFPDSWSGDRQKVLESVGKGSGYHISSVLKTLQRTSLDDIDSKRTLDRIIVGIPIGRHREVASLLDMQELHEEAQRVLQLEDEPPF
jgi:hypothetical protein